MQKIRDQIEEYRIKNIANKQIKNIELNAFLFEKFNHLYHRIQTKLIKINFYMIVLVEILLLIPLNMIKQKNLQF